MFKKFVIAIDGPAGSGKSTSAKMVAEKLNFLYIDTGAMYRAVTYLALKKNIENNPSEVTELAKNVNLNLKYLNGKTQVFAEGNDITEEIRSFEVNNKVSDISRIEGVRTALVEKQRLMTEEGRGVVMEGRDISTVVFPDADVKFFMVASIEQRAERRAKEYREKGIEISVEKIKENILSRDKIDSSREVSPLTKAPDAVEVDTSKVTINEQVEIILNKVKEIAESKGIDI